MPHRSLVSNCNNILQEYCKGHVSSRERKHFESVRVLENKGIFKSQRAGVSLIPFPHLDGIQFSEKANLELNSGSIPMGSEIEMPSLQYFQNLDPKRRASCHPKYL